MIRLVFPLVPPTAVRRSAATPTSCAPRRSWSRRFHFLSCYGFSTLLERNLGRLVLVAAWEIEKKALKWWNVIAKVSYFLIWLHISDGIAIKYLCKKREKKRVHGFLPISTGIDREEHKCVVLVDMTCYLSKGNQPGWCIMKWSYKRTPIYPPPLPLLHHHNRCLVIIILVLLRDGAPMSAQWVVSKYFFRLEGELAQ